MQLHVAPFQTGASLAAESQEGDSVVLTNMSSVDGADVVQRGSCGFDRGGCGLPAACGYFYLFGGQSAS